MLVCLYVWHVSQLTLVDPWRRKTLMTDTAMMTCCCHSCTLTLPELCVRVQRHIRCTLPALYVCAAPYKKAKQVGTGDKTGKQAGWLLAAFEEKHFCLEITVWIHQVSRSKSRWLLKKNFSLEITVQIHQEEIGRQTSAGRITVQIHQVSPQAPITSWHLSSLHTMYICGSHSPTFPLCVRWTSWDVCNISCFSCSTRDRGR